MNPSLSSASRCETSVARQLSCVSEAGIEDEVEMLKNIYMEDELLVDTLDCGTVEVSIRITPSTGGDMERQYLYLDLCLQLGTQYPREAAAVCVKSSRGLSDARLRHVVSRMEHKAMELQGCAMLYELVEMAKECLTEHNLPSDHCPICLAFFQEGDECTRSDCYHYFHVVCLTDYIQFCKRQHEQQDREKPPYSGLVQHTFMCPVCREELASDSSCLAAVSQATPPMNPTAAAKAEEIQIAPEVRAWQKEMAALLDRQRQNGGLIDLSAKDEVIDETWVRPKPSTSENGPCITKEEDMLEMRTDDQNGSSRPSAATGHLENMPEPNHGHSKNRRKRTGKPSQVKQDGLGGNFESESRSRKGEGYSPRSKERNKDRKRYYNDSRVSRGEKPSNVSEGKSVEVKPKALVDVPSGRNRIQPEETFNGQVSTSSVAQRNRRRRDRSKEKVCQQDDVKQKSGKSKDNGSKLSSAMECLSVSTSTEGNGGSSHVVGDTGAAARGKCGCGEIRMKEKE